MLSTNALTARVRSLAGRRLVLRGSLTSFLCAEQEAEAGGHVVELRRHLTVEVALGLGQRHARVLTDDARQAVRLGTVLPGFDQAVDETGALGFLGRQGLPREG